MNKHNHTECEHEQLTYCKRCQVVYCKDCTKEWRDYNYFIYNTNTTAPVPIWTYSPNTGYELNSLNIIVSCNHMSLDEQK